MDRKERLAQIRALQAGTADTSTLRAGDAAAEVRGVDGPAPVDHTAFLLEEIDRLELINGQLVQHNQELIAEMENVRADFGGDHR